MSSSYIYDDDDDIKLLKPKRIPTICMNVCEGPIVNKRKIGRNSWQFTSLNFLLARFIGIPKGFRHVSFTITFTQDLHPM